MQALPTTALPTTVYSAAQVRALDAHAIERQGIPGYELMCRAGAAVLAETSRRYPQARKMRVWCGAGNNAGDGYVVARLASARGWSVEVVAVGDPDRLPEDARRAFEDFRAAGSSVAIWQGHAANVGQDDAEAADVEIDALCGTGLTRPLEGAYAEAVAAIQARSGAVVAVDIPSGVQADTGAVVGPAVCADLTVTFIGLKIGLFTGEAVQHVGEVVFDALGSDPHAVPHTADPTPSFWRLHPDDLPRWLPPRRLGAHKGSHGSVLVVGGGLAMPGAVRLAGEAALRAGAGLVYVATRPEHVPAVVAGRPEIICHGIADTPADLARLAELAARAGVVALGPGLGRDSWSRRVWETVLAARRPTVLDADGLNLLAEAPSERDDWVLTPHPGEAARLLGCSTSDVQRDRPSALRQLQRRYGGVAVLKGAGTLLGKTGEVPYLCSYGNPGMATAGTGDVLTGTIAGLMAQFGDAWLAVRAGVLVHALAGDAAAQAGMRGMLASDLLPGIRRWVNP